MSFSDFAFTTTERKVIAGIAGIFALRMMGLFLILPLFRQYAAELAGHTPTLMGWALGAYGLTQACFQIPFGFLSDRFGRKPLITLGLLLFLLGSVVLALSEQIQAVIVGRALQGMGAIGAVLTASLTDFTRSEVRPRAMAWLGMSIGLSFVGAMLLGPLLSTWLSVPQLFWGMGLASLLALGLIWRMPRFSRPVGGESGLLPLLRGQALSLSRSGGFLMALAGVFLIHASLTLLFLFLPSWLADFGFVQAKTWQFYVPVFLLSFAGTMKVIRITEKKGRLGTVLGFAMLILSLSLPSLVFTRLHYLALFLNITLYFMAFSFLEAGLPAWITQQVPTQIKGTAMGIYTSAQFLGIFVGGVLGGLLLQALEV